LLDLATGTPRCKGVFREAGWGDGEATVEGWLQGIVIRGEGDFGGLIGAITERGGGAAGNGVGGGIEMRNFRGLGGGDGWRFSGFGAGDSEEGEEDNDSLFHYL